MPSKFWEGVKKSVKEGVSIAAEKTEEYTKIGKIKVEILGINRNIERTYTDLGKKVYALLTASKKTDVASDSKVKETITKISTLKKSLKAKEAEIEAIKKAAAQEVEKRKKGSEESVT